MKRLHCIHRSLRRALSAGLVVATVTGLLPGAFAPGSAALLFNAAGAGFAHPRRGPASPAVLRIWYGTDDPTEEALAQSLARRFEARHRGVRVSLTTYALDDLNGRMQLALSAGNPPDLVYTTPRGPGLASYVRAGQLRNQAPVWRRLGWAGRLRPGLLVEYNRLLAANSGVPGHVYAVPYVMAAVGILYNKAIFNRLRLRVPRTLAQLETVAARVKRAGLTPFGFGNADGWVGDDWWLTLVNAQTGPAALAGALRLDKRFDFRGRPFQNAGAIMQRWAVGGYFTHGFGGLDAQDSMQAFFLGHTAMQLISSTQNEQILTLAQQAHVPVGVFAFPRAVSGRAPVMPQSGYAGWAIPRASSQPALAAAFIDHVLSPETARLLIAHGLLPALRLPGSARPVAAFQHEYLSALETATPGVYLDAAPIPNFNATMEANVQLLLANHETPAFMTVRLQATYTSYGAQATSTRTDGEF